MWLKARGSEFASRDACKAMYNNAPWVLILEPPVIVIELYFRAPAPKAYSCHLGTCLKGIEFRTIRTIMKLRIRSKIVKQRVLAWWGPMEISDK